jgi:rod shape determining protein RodA
MNNTLLTSWFARRVHPTYRRTRGVIAHIDGTLLTALLLLIGAGLIILYSASNETPAIMDKQLLRIGIALFAMWILAQISPGTYRKWTPWFFLGSLLLLGAVLIIGEINKGAQRWLDLWLFQFQPSELLKLAVPMMIAWYLYDKRLPPSLKSLIIPFFIIIIPAVLIAKQPDLGTALLVTISGFSVILLAGMSIWLIVFFLMVMGACTPILWHFMHGYQRDRILTFFNPERDPLGAGYHIIQSKIALGSGGVFGKGWLMGSQSHLQFLPEHATDFIFSVCGEEFGMMGAIVLIVLYLVIGGRGLYISAYAQDTYSRLLAGGLSLTFLIAAFINIGMVTGVLPVVGLPLPLVSYGGTSMITLIASFGILMSIHTHRKLLSS